VLRVCCGACPQALRLAPLKIGAQTAVISWSKFNNRALAAAGSSSWLLFVSDAQPTFVLRAVLAPLAIQLCAPKPTAMECQPGATIVAKTVRRTEHARHAPRQRAECR